MPANARSRKRLKQPPSRRPAPRKAPSKALTQRLRFESFLLELSAAFARVSADGVEREVEVWLGKLAEFIDADRSSLWELDAEGDAVRLIYFYSTPGLPRPSIDGSAAEMAWLTDQYRRGNIVAWSRVPNDIPPEAIGERAWALGVAAKSVLCIPVSAGRITRSIVFTSVRQYRRWPASLIQRLRLVGEIFSSAITRQRAEASRLRAERQLRESEERFRGAFANSAIGIAIVSPEGHWMQVNPALCTILGYSEAELLTTNFQALTVPEDMGSNLDYLRRALAGEIDHYELPKRYIRKDGQTISAILTASLVRDARGRPLHFVSQVQDITERTLAQQEIERLRLELMHFGRVALVGQLMASLAHELMQPITAAVGNSEAGQRLLATDRADRDEARAILADVVDNCMRAADVVNSVRNLLRKQPRPHRRVDLNRLVKEVADMMHSDLIRRQVRLVMRLDATLPEINADPVELQQVILNLILNGAEALSQNPPPERELVIETAQRSQGIELTVCDRGIGADPAHLQRMFEPFFTTKPDGIGMGLPICWEIVRAHHGLLSAENNASGGVTVRCLLPLPAS